ncbi:unnamed protein product [Durusdinium trenchii]|uniref:Association with the SNF1 complex (ASC) domain-containing protein n=1 Tax=Durusdinium trenchii TaxID=1381693 RepID=A0ABP0SXI1_9DINO
MTSVAADWTSNTLTALTVLDIATFSSAAGSDRFGWIRTRELSCTHGVSPRYLMGNQQARKVLASRGSGSTLPMNGSLGPHVGAQSGPSEQQSTSVLTDSEKDDCIPVVFTWTHGGQNVFLAASFNGWKDQIPMVRSGQEFSVVQELPRGVHQYKFIVDDQWRFSPDQPRMQDSSGNMNNVLDISTYQKFQITDDKETPGKFGQQIPDPNDYTLDAPVVPMVLSKSIFSAIPTRLMPGQGPMNIPIHCLCDHIYLKDRSEDAPLVVSVTHRYGQKYSTTVYVARNSFCGTATEPNGPNFLKAAVRRDQTFSA